MASVTHLRALQALETAVRTGSLKAAADDLAITPAAVGQRIKTLEDYLGVDLVVRGRTGVRPTRELVSALAHLTGAFRELRRASDMLEFQRVHDIQIVAETDLAELWLARRLAVFRRNRPNARFCINGAGDAPTRLGKVDCEIWFGGARGLPGESRLFRDYLLPVSSPENHRRIAEAAGRARLEGFPLLHLDCYQSDPESIGWPEWARRYGHRFTAAGRGIRYRHVVDALAAVRADAGLIICGLSLVLDELARGRVSVPFPMAEGAWAGASYRIAFSEGAMRRSQVVQFREWVLDEGRETEVELVQRASQRDEHQEAAPTRDGEVEMRVADIRSSSGAGRG